MLTIAVRKQIINLFDNIRKLHLRIQRLNAYLSLDFLRSHQQTGVQSVNGGGVQTSGTGLSVEIAGQFLLLGKHFLLRLALLNHRIQVIVRTGSQSGQRVGGGTASLGRVIEVLLLSIPNTLALRMKIIHGLHRVANLLQRLSITAFRSGGLNVRVALGLDLRRQRACHGSQPLLFLSGAQQAIGNLLIALPLVQKRLHVVRALTSGGSLFLQSIGLLFTKLLQSLTGNLSGLTLRG